MISVVIPVRQGGNPCVTLASLACQSGVQFEVIVSHDREPGNANRARNQGVQLARGEYLLFSDDDIAWEPGALVALKRALQQNPEASFAYGAYLMGGHVYCNRPYNRRSLQHSNYISTMSLIRRAHFPGFDEKIRRLQDWDLWLTMAEDGKSGVSCGKVLFSTERREGITWGNPYTWEKAAATLAEKHNLPIGYTFAACH